MTPPSPPSAADSVAVDLDDAARVRAAERLLPSTVAGTAPLDRLAELAARLLGTGSAQVSLLTTEQVVAGAAGAATSSLQDTSPIQDSLCTVTAASGGPLLVPDAVSDHRVAHLPPVTSGAVGAYLGVPLLSAGNVVVGALCVFDPQPRSWSPADVGLLSQLAASVTAELELGALAAEHETDRVRWETAIEAAGIGSFELDLSTEQVRWDRQLKVLFGLPVDAPLRGVEEILQQVHPDDRSGIRTALTDAAEEGGTYRSEYRVRLGDGSYRWLSSRGRVIPGSGGAPGRLVGSVQDVTELRTARDDAAELLASMATGFIALDTDWTMTYLNTAAERVLSTPAAELVGRNVWDTFPGLEDSAFGQAYHRAVTTGETAQVEAYYAHLHSWFEVQAVPTGQGLALYFLDITARHADQEAAQAASDRLELIAQVSSELMATLDVEAAVGRLAQLLVPALADWCIVTLLDDTGLRDVGWHHNDPAAAELLTSYATTRMSALHEHSYLHQALRSAQPRVIETDATARVAALLAPGPARDALLQLAPTSGIVLPLVSRGRTVGALTLFRDAGRPAMTATGRTTALEVSARAALAVDNARQYTAQRFLAEALQRSLLTDPPEPDHVQITARYRPAAEAASVGGDWYDSFLQPDGATMLVIGDVVGHDTEAAAAMGQVRGLLRGIAWHSGAGPAEVLAGLDAAMNGLLITATATAVVARIEQTPDEHERGVTRLRWSNAGHPPPMLINPDRTVLPLTALRPELLLGVDPGTKRSDAVLTVDRGSTVLLYTDGLIERRGQDLDEGLALLADTLNALAEQPLDDLCDQLLDRMLPDRPDDDVAIIAVRLHRQDQPRPPEAGPNRVPDTVGPPIP